MKNRNIKHIQDSQHGNRTTNLIQVKAIDFNYICLTFFNWQCLQARYSIKLHLPIDCKQDQEKLIKFSIILVHWQLFWRWINKMLDACQLHPSNNHFNLLIKNLYFSVISNAPNQQMLVYAFRKAFTRH